MMVSQALFQFAADACDKSGAGGFFGLLPWYHYIPKDRFTSSGDGQSCDLSQFHLLPTGGQTSDIPLVLLAVIDDLLRIAALVALGYVIYGAIQYMISQGSPDRTSSAQQTIINAIIGLVVALSAVALVSFIGTQLGNASS